MKLSGGILVLVSIVLAGMSLSLRLKRRRDFLGETVVFLSTVGIEIEFVNLPVFEILKKIEKSAGCKSLDFITLCLLNFKDGEDFSTAWSQAVEDSSLPMKKDEREKLESLGGLIGTSDVQGQRSILALFGETFSLYHKRADEVYEKYGKMCVTVSGIIGMGVFIFMM